MTIYVIGSDTVTTTKAGKYRAHRQGCWWVGDFADLAAAKRALQIANSAGAQPHQRGFYDGGSFAADETRAVHESIFGYGDNPVTEDDVRRTILAGERFSLHGGMPVRAQ